MSNQETKVCTKCKETKDINSYHLRCDSTGISGRKSICKECYKKRWRWRYRNDKSFREYTLNRRTPKENLADYTLYKSSCKRCGTDDIRVLEFDHLESFNKKFNISNIRNGCGSYIDMINELKKCQVLCSNCHKIITYERMKKCWRLDPNIDLRMLKIEKDIIISRLNESEVYTPKTNCNLEYMGQRYNINTLGKESIVYLLVHLNSMRLSAQDLGLDLIHDGFKIQDWIDDLKVRLLIVDRKAEEAKLKAIDAELESLLSNERKVELRLDELKSQIQ